MVFYFLVYKDGVASTARKIEGVTVGGRKMGNIDGVDTFADLMYRPAMPVKEVRFKGWMMSKVPDLSDLDDMDDEGRDLREETLAMTLSRMRSGESLADAYKRGASKKRMTLHSRIKEFGSGHGRAKAKAKAASCHGRVTDSGHSKVSPSNSEVAQPPPSITCDNGTELMSCLIVKTLEQSLNSCKMEPASELHSSHSRTHTSSKGSVGGSLSFSTIEIRQFTRVLSDNPACSSGPPIGLGWKFSQKPIVASVDHYESTREPRRSDSDLRLSVKRRETILRALGYSTRDLIEADRVRKKDQILRERTVCRLRYRRLEETVETAKRITHMKSTHKKSTHGKVPAGNNRGGTQHRRGLYRHSQKAM